MAAQEEDALSQYYETIARINNDDRADSIAQCIDDEGDIDMDQYAQMRQKEEELEAAERKWFLAMQEDVNAEEEEPVKEKKPRSRRSVWTLSPYYFDDAGNVVYLRPTQTFWYLLYVRQPPLQDKKFLAKFRRRFRLPYDQYKGLLLRIEYSGRFTRWYGKDAVGNPSSPIQLLLLGALRYLGRGLTFDDLEECTAISEETHRQFFHAFTQYGADTLYPAFVKMPTTAAEFATGRAEFDDGGLHGAGFSTDATNVMMWRCSHNLKQAHMGWKQSHPARTYNISVNHRRQILYSTKGNAARWNDKTLAYCDEFVHGIRKGKILQDVSFRLFSWSRPNRPPGDSPIKPTSYRGAWGLSDNGYHRWSCTQAPGKNDVLLTEKRLSQWIESFRKDVECTFGILKGRFRILKTGIRVEGIAAADNIWLTCCALHNLLLEADGLSKEWEHGVSSDWEGELGENEADDMRRYAPTAMQRLANPESFGSREHEESCARATPLCGHQEDDEMSVGSNGCGEEMDEHGCIFVNSLSYSEFRERLVVHFDIMYRYNKVIWPRSRQEKY